MGNPKLRLKILLLAGAALGACQATSEPAAVNVADGNAAMPAEGDFNAADVTMDAESAANASDVAVDRYDAAPSPSATPQDPPFEGPTPPPPPPPRR